MKLSFKDVYTQANINTPSLAQFNREKFIEFFRFTGSGRQRKYDIESVEVMSIISRMYAESATYEAIKEQLEIRFGIPITCDSKEHNALIKSSTNQQEMVEDIKELLEEISNLKNMVNKLTVEVEDRDKILMENIRMIQSQQQINNIPWWAKLFRNKQ